MPGERSTSAMTKCCASMNSDLDNGSCWKSGTLNMQIDVSIDLHSQRCVCCVDLVFFSAVTVLIILYEARKRFLYCA